MLLLSWGRSAHFLTLFHIKYISLCVFCFENKRKKQKQKQYKCEFRHKILYSVAAFVMVVVVKMMRQRPMDSKLTKI